MTNGVEVALDEAAADPSGAASVSGDVNNRWGDVFGAAALGPRINTGVATTEEPQLIFSGIGTISHEQIDAADGVQQSASGVANCSVDRGLSMPPTIRVGAGTRVIV